MKEKYKGKGVVPTENNDVITTLDALAPGQAAAITAVPKEGGMARRLTDLGFLRGERVACIMKSPLGDPCAYRIRGTLIALRKTDAKMIAVSR